MAKKVLIVGGVAGGASAAARLRRLDEQAQIILLERGPYISYANCGLPYHVGGVIKKREALLLQSPQMMHDKFNVDVRVHHEAKAIHREQKLVDVLDMESGRTYQESYDILVLSPGSSPFVPPIPGRDASRVMTIWTVPDTDRIRDFIEQYKPASAVVVGGGFIGLEMAENLHAKGIQVTLVEMLNQVMAPLDYEMAQLLHAHMAGQGVTLALGDSVEAFEENNQGVTVKLKSGRTLQADLVILAIGVRANNSLAKEAGLTVSQRGGIVVDEHLRTSDPAIYAVGDAIEVKWLVDNSATMIPLAGPANKQGRIAADNIAGLDAVYTGTQGTAIAKVFDLSTASTGINEKALQKQQKVRGKDYQTLIITQNSHASYYPGANPLTIKLIFSLPQARILGAQIVGRDGVDKRIDTLSTAMRLGASAVQLKDLEMAYAPPFSSAKDPVNMAGFVAENILGGKVAFSPWDVAEQEGAAGRILLDVREAAERQVSAIASSVHIPLGQLRQRLNELDKQKEVVVFCAVGVRAYNGARMLSNHGFEHVKVYPGGMRFYQATHYQQEGTEGAAMQAAVADSGHAHGEDAPQEQASMVMHLDCSGMQCPGPIMQVFDAMKSMKDGQLVEAIANDPGFARDIVAWTRRTGNTLVKNERRGNQYAALIRKGSSRLQAQAAAGVPAARNEGKTIIVFSGDLDRVIASFIIANGAAAMGRPVTMFFTFWGLNVLRRSQGAAVSKNFIEKMFGLMMPRGADKLKLSKMNMAGMGTGMMKKVMRDKHVDSLNQLIDKAKGAGVKLVACTMSMDVMGIKPEELIDGVELGGVGAYLGDAEESNVNLFI